MSEPKFTPGPWMVRKFEGEQWPDKRISISSEDQGAIAISPRYAYEDQMIADAQLIAAAPDLYEALEYLLSIKVVEADVQYGTACAKAISALIKARGEN